MTENMGWFSRTLNSIKSIQIRPTLSQVITLGLVVSSALIIWKGFMCMTGSESPVVVVLSESMEPGFARFCFRCRRKDRRIVSEFEMSELGGSATLMGDILFLSMSNDPIRAGEIVVFNIDFPRSEVTRSVFSVPPSPLIPGRSIPIVHRVIEVHERPDTGEVNVLTKGDNNDENDRILYAQGQKWLQRRHIMGRAVGFLPYVGWMTIIMTDRPIIKYIIMGALGLLVITSKD